MFSRTERCGSSACSRSAGTRTTPARIASYGWRAFSGRPATRISPPSTERRARERVEQLVLPLALERGDAEHLARLRVRTTRRAGRRPSAPSTSSAATAPACSRGRRPASLRRHPVAPLPPPRARPLRRACARRSSPRRPPRGTIVATAPPSRRIVARSQRLDHLVEPVGDEQHGAALLALARIAANTRSARSEGRAAVISSSSRSCGSRASARARSIIRSSGSGTSPDELAEVDVELHRLELAAGRRPRSAAGQAQVRRDGQVGHERRVLEDGREPDPGRLRRRAHADRRSR